MHQGVTLPDAGANANFILSQGTQTISGPTALFGTISLGASQTGYGVGSASQSGITITGSGTAFTSAMVGGIIIFGGSALEISFIVGYVNATTLTASVSSVYSSQSYLILYGGNQMDSYGNSSSKVNYITNTTNQLILGSGTTTTIDSVAPTASRVYTINDQKANASFMLGSGTGLVQYGAFVAGTSTSNPKSFTVTFPHAFPSTPTGIICTAYENGFTDPLSVMCSALSTTSAILSIFNTSSLSSGWGVSATIFWMAFE